MHIHVHKHKSCIISNLDILVDIIIKACQHYIRHIHVHLYEGSSCVSYSFPVTQHGSFFIFFYFFRDIPILLIATPILLIAEKLIKGIHLGAYMYRSHPVCIYLIIIFQLLYVFCQGHVIWVMH